MSLRALGLLLLAAAAAAKEPSYPEPPDGVTEFVVDEAELISAGDRKEINALAQELFAEKDIQIMVVTLPRLARYDPGRRNIEWYARKLFDAWGIGSPEHNFGMLLVVARDDRRARIELGAGWLHRKDRDARRIMDERIIPAFKDGDFSRGILLGAEGLAAIARDQGLPAMPRPWWWTPLWVALALLFMGVLNSLLQRGVDGWGYKVVLYSVLAPVWIFGIFTLGLAHGRRRARSSSYGYGSGYGGGWGGGGFGGGSFGGGGFSGGGGATGSW